MPLPSRLRVLRPCVGKCRLRNEEIDDTAHTLAVAYSREALRFRSARQQISRGANAIRGRLQSVIRREHLQRDLLKRLLSLRVRRLQLIGRRAQSVLAR